MSGDEKITYQQIVNMTIQTLAAGYSTTAVAVTCLLQFLAHDLDLQERMHNEIIESVGKDRKPKLEDKHSHPFIQVNIFVFDFYPLQHNYRLNFLKTLFRQVSLNYFD